MEALHPHHRHGCQEDEEEGDGGGNGRSRRDQFLDLDDLGFLTIEGTDRNRRTILRVVAKFLPGKNSASPLLYLREKERERKKKKTRTE